MRYETRVSVRTSLSVFLAIGIATGVALTAALSCQRTGSLSQQANVVAKTEVPPKDLEGRAVFGTGESELFGFMSVFNGSDFTQGIACGSSWNSDDPNMFALFNNYRNPLTEEWEPHTFEYSASFKLQRAASQRKNVFFVSGVSASGDGVIEKWRAGGGAVGGGSQSTPPLMRRQEIYRGQALGEVRELAADPDGRFLLLLHGSNPLRLSRMDLSPGYLVTEILSALNEPALNEVSGYHVSQHVTEGRIWSFEGLDLRTLLYDFENDGTFDSWATVDEDTWQSLGYEGPVWTDDFINDFWWD